MGRRGSSALQLVFVVFAAGHRLEQFERGGLGGRDEHFATEILEPGGAFIAVAQDPQGAWFAVVGPKEAS